MPAGFFIFIRGAGGRHIRALPIPLLTGTLDRPRFGALSVGGYIGGAPVLGRIERQ